MNIDTDTQWAYWSGIKDFEAKYRPYLQTQIGNPEGETKPNKKCARSACASLPFFVPEVAWTCA